MRSNNPVVRVVGSIILIIIMAVLPMLTAFCQDRLTLERPIVDQIQTVELNFREKISPLGLLALMNHGRNWNLVENANTSMTQAEAEAAALAALKPYQELGLIDRKVTFSVRLAEVSAVSLPIGTAGMIWTVSLVGSLNGYEQCGVYLAMDDTTGKIVNFNYSRDKAFSKNELRSLAKGVSTVFFDELGIEDYTEALNAELEQPPLGENAVGIFYRFGDQVYGEVNMGFIAHPYGFYVNYISYDDNTYRTDEVKEVNRW